jgi:hypothetical protein
MPGNPCGSDARGAPTGASRAALQHGPPDQSPVVTKSESAWHDSDARARRENESRFPTLPALGEKEHLMWPPAVAGREHRAHRMLNSMSRGSASQKDKPDAPYFGPRRQLSSRHNKLNPGSSGEDAAFGGQPRDVGSNCPAPKRCGSADIGSPNLSSSSAEFEVPLAQTQRITKEEP